MVRWCSKIEDPPKLPQDISAILQCKFLFCPYGYHWYHDRLRSTGDQRRSTWSPISLPSMPLWIPMATAGWDSPFFFVAWECGTSSVATPVMDLVSIGITFGKASHGFITQVGWNPISRQKIVPLHIGWFIETAWESIATHRGFLVHLLLSNWEEATVFACLEVFQLSVDMYP